MIVKVFKTNSKYCPSIYFFLKRAAGQTHSRTLSRHAKALVRHTTLTIGIMMVLIFKSHNHLTLLQRDGGGPSLHCLSCLLGWGKFVRQVFTMYPMLNLNLQASCLNLLSAGITGVSYHIWQKRKF